MKHFILGGYMIVLYLAFTLTESLTTGHGAGFDTGLRWFVIVSAGIFSLILITALSTFFLALMRRSKNRCSTT